MDFCRRLAVFQRTDNHSLRWFARTRPKRNDFHRAEFFSEGLNDFVRMICAVNDREAAAVFQITKTGIDPILNRSMFFRVVKRRRFRCRG